MNNQKITASIDSFDKITLTFTDNNNRIKHSLSRKEASNLSQTLKKNANDVYLNEKPTQAVLSGIFFAAFVLLYLLGPIYLYLYGDERGHLLPGNTAITLILMFFAVFSVFIESYRPIIAKTIAIISLVLSAGIAILAMQAENDRKKTLEENLFWLQYCTGQDIRVAQEEKKIPNCRPDFMILEPDG